MRIKKKEDIFFVKFREFSNKIVEASEVFKDFVHNYEDIEAKMEHMKAIETECDRCSHDILEELRGSFVTPFDREDIYALAREMDEIVDMMEEASNRLVVFNVQEVTEGAIQMVDKLSEAVEQLHILFDHLSEATKGDTVKQQIIEVNRIENEGDDLHRAILYKMFRETNDGAELMKWYHIYQRIEGSLDACENVANLVQGVISKYA